MPDPTYRQVAEDLRRQIESGELGPGARLPTELDPFVTALSLASGSGRHQRRDIDDTPWSLQTSFYPMTFLKRGVGNLTRAADIPDSGRVPVETRRLPI
jgi:Bacterial regulatory proteins, gntR family